MDMLYRAYSSPLDLMYMYINRGRFGNFVEGFLQAEYERRKADTEKNNEWMMWVAYIHSYSDKPFNEWKKRFTGNSTTVKKSKDEELTEEDIGNIIGKLFKKG